MKLNHKQKAIYKRRWANLVAHLKNTPLGDDVEPLPKPELYRFLRRCQAKHPDGQLWGFRALIPASPVNQTHNRKS